MKQGQAQRKQLGRQTHDTLNIKARTHSALELLERSMHGRVPALVKLKYELMADSPFGYFRGAVPVMAADLSVLPNSGIVSQLCGDAHVRNVGAYAAPDGRLVFDINDFDETIRGPFEWDLKRMAASISLAGRGSGQKDSAVVGAVQECVLRYSVQMKTFAKMPFLELGHFLVHRFSKVEPVHTALLKAERSTPLHTLEQLTEPASDKEGSPRRFKEIKPMLTRVSKSQAEAVLASLKPYSEMLEPQRQHLLSRYRPVARLLHLFRGKRTERSAFFADQGGDSLRLQRLPAPCASRPPQRQAHLRRAARHAVAVRPVPGLDAHWLATLSGAPTERPQRLHRSGRPGRQRIDGICRGVRRFAGARTCAVGRSGGDCGLSWLGRWIRRSAEQIWLEVRRSDGKGLGSFAALAEAQYEDLKRRIGFPTAGSPGGSASDSGACTLQSIGMPTAVRSHAKINLGLYIGAPRADGFHGLVTVYQTLELFDVVTVTARQAAVTSLHLTSNDGRVPTDERNTAWKMVELALAALGVTAEVAIHIEKRLPVQGGLGAGSANAVAALVGLEAELGVAGEVRGFPGLKSETWGTQRFVGGQEREAGPSAALRFAQDDNPVVGAQDDRFFRDEDRSGWGARRLEIAALVGSDVPLFLVGGTVLGLDRGQQVQPLPDIEPTWCVIATPSVGVSTPQAFRDWDALCAAEGLTQEASQAKLEELSRAYASAFAEAIPQGGQGVGSSGVLSNGENLAGPQESALVRTGILSWIANDFERVVFAQHPSLAEIKRILLGPGAPEAALHPSSLMASLSGSGSSLFGLYLTRGDAEAARERLRTAGVQSQLTRTLPRPAYWREMIVQEER
jgi:4-diphosphocytidyl-2-C-methyl-D-erythritol kinase